MARQFTAEVKDIDNWEEVARHAIKEWDKENEFPGLHNELLSKDGGPYAIYVELEPNTVLERHSHSQNQWQIIVEGSCEMNGEELTPISLHYTDGGAEYGPIIAGNEGVSFLTLREQAPAGYHPANPE